MLFLVPVSTVSAPRLELELRHPRLHQPGTFAHHRSIPTVALVDFAPHETSQSKVRSEAAKLPSRCQRILKKRAR
jgi:hypothetical protein